MEVPARLAELADTCLTASRDVADGWTGAATALEVPAGAAGDTYGASQLLSAHADASGAAAVAVGRLVAVLEADVDAVYLCAFDCSTTDEAVATGLQSSYSGPTPTGPTPTPGPAPTPPPGPTEPPVPSPSAGPSPTPSPRVA